MIYYLEGNLVERTPTYVVIDCSGVGYMLTISLNTYAHLPLKGSCKLFVEHMFMRDDLPKHFGFFDHAERDLFRHLVSVSGVGGNSAIMMLSSLSAAEIQQAILSANVATLKSIKGIGEKTAQRIIVDLKGKMGKMTNAIDLAGKTANPIKEEALSALMMLGFQKAVADKQLEKILSGPSAPTTVEDLIKQTLKNL